MGTVLKAWGWWLAGVLSVVVLAYAYHRRLLALGAESSPAPPAAVDDLAPAPEPPKPRRPR